jgi:hypothetical protein
MPVLSSGQGETLRFPGAHTEDELGVLPGLELPGVDVKRAAAHQAE